MEYKIAWVTVWTMVKVDFSGQSSGLNKNATWTLVQWLFIGKEIESTTPGWISKDESQQSSKPFVHEYVCVCYKGLCFCTWDQRATRPFLLVGGWRCPWRAGLWFWLSVLLPHTLRPSTLNIVYSLCLTWSPFKDPASASGLDSYYRISSD